jgi:hypothetical protein
VHLSGVQPEKIREHAERTDLPVDEIVVVVDTWSCDPTQSQPLRVISGRWAALR